MHRVEWGASGSCVCPIQAALRAGEAFQHDMQSHLPPTPDCIAVTNFKFCHDYFHQLDGYFHEHRNQACNCIHLTVSVPDGSVLYSTRTCTYSKIIKSPPNHSSARRKVSLLTSKLVRVADVLEDMVLVNQFIYSTGHLPRNTSNSQL